MARRRGKRSLAGRMLHHMKPNRVAARFISGGRHQTFKSIAKSPLKSKAVHTPKSGRRAYQQQVARERKAIAAAAAKDRKQAAADQKAARAEQRRQQPRPSRPGRAPIAVNARTGRPITLREAERAVQDANARADRLAAGLPGDRPAPRPRKPKPEMTPLQNAVAEVTGGKPKPRKTAATKPARPKPVASRRTCLAKKQSKSAADVIAGLIPSQAVLAPPATGRATPQPTTRRARSSQRGVYGAVLRKTCACGGTGRIPLYDDHGDPRGSTSCPEHGRRARGERKRRAGTAARDAGLPGLKGFLAKKRDGKAKRLDKHQARAYDRATSDPRHMGPTEPCPETAHCRNGIWDRKKRDKEREYWIAEHIEAARLEDKRIPSRRRLRVLASRALPYEHCLTCGGVGRIPTSTEVAPDGQSPAWEWRAGADLRDGHRSTARERSTGRRMTENAARVERRRKLPRL